MAIHHQAVMNYFQIWSVCLCVCKKEEEREGRGEGQREFSSLTLLRGSRSQVVMRSSHPPRWQSRPALVNGSGMIPY